MNSNLKKKEKKDGDGVEDDEKIKYLGGGIGRVIDIQKNGKQLLIESNYDQFKLVKLF